MKLLVDSLELKRFKRRASRAYPREVYGILLGKELSDQRTRKFRIERIAVPDIRESTNEYVIPDYDDQDRIVKELGFTLIGSIHSHPNAAPTLSDHDHRYWEKGEMIIGILSVRKRNVRKTTELKFWRKNVACPVKYKVIRRDE